MSLQQTAIRTDPTHPVPLRDRYHAVRAQSLLLQSPLSAEDAQAQSMPFASPSKWHLAHTTWFFETFVLAQATANYQWLKPHYQVLFNSYYNSIGPQHPRPQRGLLTRPSLDEVIEYRQRVDEAMDRLFDQTGAGSELSQVIELGINHEQQHQELMLTDLKHLLSFNPLYPVYRDDLECSNSAYQQLAWCRFPGGLKTIGANEDRFCFDNETPRHQVQLNPFAIADRPVTNAEYMEFIDDGGYQNAAPWLSDGWDQARQQHWEAPLYWRKLDDQWMQFTLSGLRSIDLHAPVCHISFYEAQAYAAWAGARLPLEAEWEVAAADVPVDGNFVHRRRLHPGGELTGSSNIQLYRMFGDVWEWTGSPYTAYPGYHPTSGALGEYNGKFMCNHLVLRGGSCVSPADHLRASYRNFFQPELRWQFSGVRLARDV